MIHLDMLGLEVSDGDYVCAAYNYKLTIFKVVDLSNKMIKIQPLQGKTARSIRAVYARDIIRLTDDQAKAIIYKIMKEA